MKKITVHHNSNINKELHFVLVHGAGHGGWCWYKIRTLLEAEGHKVTCLDLTCSGIDRTDFNAVSDFSEYNQPLITFMSSLPHNYKVILVGHSLGGVSVTDAINKFAEKIHLAVYIAAIMSKNGYSRERAKYGGPDVYEYIYGLGRDQPPTGVMVKPELRRSVLYNMCSDQDCTLASMLLRPTPARGMNVWFDEGPGAEGVPRVFVRTLNDHIMTQEKQDHMVKNWPPRQVFALWSDHSPFFSVPDTLSGVLLQAASDFIGKCPNLSFSRV